MTNTSDNKPSVVDDFFSALFANHNTTADDSGYNDNSMASSSSSSNNSLVHNYKTDYVDTAQQEDKLSGVKRERLDEFDEYSLLSKRKNSDTHGRRQQRNKRFTPAIDSPQILSKRSIDWNDVTPESRMLVRQIPKYIEKQDLMDYFSKYGEVVEVVFKNTFGFVQFENARSCARAVQCENGKQFKGVVLDLEVCRRKPYFAREEVTDKKTVNKRVRNVKYPTIKNRPKRQVPITQVIAFGDVSPQYMCYIDSIFKEVSISIDSMIVPYSTSREPIIKQLVVEGVKAVVMVTRELESQNKVNLQLFSPSGNGGVKYDEYDNITVNEAVIVVQQSISIDNTLSVYNIMQSSNLSSPPAAVKPTIPQLLATLVSGLSHTTTPPPISKEQPSIAALLSTVASGNPVLAQMLQSLNTPQYTHTAPPPPPQQQQQQQPLLQLNNNQLRDILSSLYPNTL